MKNFFKIVLLLGSLPVVSCVSIMEPATTNVRIVRNKVSKLVVNQDTLSGEGTENFIQVMRSNAPLSLSVFNDSVSKSVSVEPVNAFAYYMNIPCNYGLGMLIDKHTPKRYVYPRTIYLKLDNQDSSYLTYIPLDSKFARKNILKISPLKPLSLLNSSFELSYERVTGKSWTSQVMASWLLPVNPIRGKGELPPDYQGYRIAFEEKYYLHKSAPQGSYFAVELDHLKVQFNELEYFYNPDDVPEDEQYINPEKYAYPDTFVVNKKTYNINFKYGYQYFINNLSVDAFIGLGLRYKDTKHSGRINPGDIIVSPVDLNIYYLYMEQGKNFALSMPFNVRIGWSF